MALTTVLGAIAAVAIWAAWPGDSAALTETRDAEFAVTADSTGDLIQTDYSMTRTGSGTFDGADLTGRIEYIVRDSSGRVKEREIIHNTVTTPGLGATIDRMFDESIGLSGSNDAFAAIYLTLDTVTAGNLTDGTANDDLGTATTNLSVNNPLNDASVDTSTDGTAIVDVQFTASGAAVIAQIKLIKAANNSTSFVGADVFASQDVTITLQNGDSVTFTWTVTVS